MTIKQLIEELQKIEDQNILVMTSGYEGGFNDVTFIVPPIYNMALNVNTEWYYGDHEKAEDIMEEDKDKYQIVKAIII